ncbi:ABC transporter permease [Tindallia californiensis]|uniref:Monosaccharide ABC transporter membrane protein, CUT2 family n=1 Tax=Tindallia californiensis TaxID=159292 RepID=A0A1H3PAA5_9FIRM|nr:ABC transporter permease [Tindallia californiensis]SDY98021.1 monosaccharide ABC transporter membrane protein, CUT2 family [Tindallia californiensis]
MKHIESFKKYGIFMVLVALMTYFSFASSSFLSTNNLFTIARQVSMLGIAAVGMAFVLLIGGIDLSIGSQVTLVNIVAAWLMVNAGIHPVLAVLLALAMSTSIGFFNGWIISTIKMPPIIVTLSMMIILEGVAYLVCKGLPIFGFPSSFSVIGQGYVGIIPIPVIIMVVIMGLGAFILNRTYFGRYFYAVGGNEEAAALSGINVVRVKYLVYSLSGLFAGIAGIVMLSRTNSGQVLVGKGFEFEVLTACVLGGVSVNGGQGKISNVFAGVLMIGVLSNGLVLLNVSQFTQMVIKGSVLLLAVAFDSIQKQQRNKKIKEKKTGAETSSDG